MQYFLVYYVTLQVSMQVCQYSNLKDCASLWKLFFDAFAYKEPCNVKPEDYSSFISAADHNVQTQDRVRFWINVCII